MTDTEINIAIAEHCGFVWYRIPQGTFGKLHELRSLFLPAVCEYEGQSPDWTVKADMSEHVCNWTYMQTEGHVPNYTTDLNAMWTAEEELSGEQWNVYLTHLAKIVFPPHATARQRAEAFLRTIWKWKE